MSETINMGRAGWRRSVCVALVGLVIGALAACASAPPPLPPAAPMPPGAGFDGVWFSPQFEHMYLVQIGDRVRGVYAYEYGGSLEGQIQGNLLTFQWSEPGDRGSARPPMQGRGYLQLSVEGNAARLSGKWGYGEDSVQAGPWTAEYVRAMTPEDPRNLAQLRP